MKTEYYYSSLQRKGFSAGVWQIPRYKRNVPHHEGPWEDNWFLDPTAVHTLGMSIWVSPLSRSYGPYFCPKKIGVEKFRMKNMPLHCLFLNIQKAFVWYLVLRSVIWWAMQSKGISKTNIDDSRYAPLIRLHGSDRCYRQETLSYHRRYTPRVRP